MLTKALIVDIDGTVADCSHRENHITGGNKDWVKFYAECVFDKPIKKNVSLVKTLYHAYNLFSPTKLIFLTGRPESVKLQTQTWLSNNFEMQHYLMMRETNKWIPNFVHKKESVESLIKQDYLPLIFIDDNSQSCQVVRDLLPSTIILQVV